MAKLGKTAQEQSEDPFTKVMEQTLMSQTVEPTAATVVCPTMVVGCNRKINTGNFENIDIYAGITVPILTLPGDLEAFKAAAEAAADLGFAIVSQETAERYQLIKEMGKKRT